MKKKENKISRYLSLILRHKPEEIGIVPNDGGWVSVSELIQLISQKKIDWDFSEDILREVVRNNEKQRFRIRDDGKMIRASQGHSYTVDLGLEPKEPPEYLYQGTARRFVAEIFEKGLLKMNRHAVHLTDDEYTAVSVGRRHGDPIVLQVHSGKMYRDNYIFYLSDNKVWLVDYVPPQYLSKYLS